MDNNEYKKQLIHRTYKFSLQVIKLIDTFNSHDLSLSIIAAQLLRSAMSIGANIVEAQSCLTKKDFINFLTHSLKSANETKYWLGLIRDSGKVSLLKVNPLINECDEICKQLGSSIIKLKKQTE